MSVRTAKLFGMIALILGLTVYCIAVVALAVNILPVHWTVDFLFYLVTGIVWIIPARWLVVRINREND